MRFMKPVLAALAIGVTATTFVPSADARDRYRHRQHHGDFAAGAAGFALGAFLGAITQPRYGYDYYDDYEPGYYYQEPRYFYAPAPRVYYRQAPEYYGPCSIPGGSRSRPANAMC